MPTALFVSPHLDDVAFSCSGTLLALAAAGWRTVLVTAFTASVPSPTGFALACQTDKGLGPEVDYMALRRAEDDRFAAAVGVDALHRLGHPEAPHRGYSSAPALFAEALAGDEAWRAVAADLGRLAAEHRPELVLAPQALGDHVDHRHAVRAVLAAVPADRVAWYRDAPYAVRRPDAAPSALLPGGLTEVAVDAGAHLGAKLDAAAAYATQLAFQFRDFGAPGEAGEPAMRTALGGFAAAEARRLGVPGGAAAEALLVPPSSALPRSVVLAPAG